MRHIAFRRLALPFAIAMFVTGTACHHEPEAPAVGSGATGTSEAPLPSAATLAPIITPSGGSDRIPETVVVELARVVPIETEDDDRVTSDTVLSFDPDVDGSLRLTGPSTLTFTPNRGFAPETKYVATLESLDLGKSVLKPPRDGAWRREFTTAPFKLAQALLTEYDPAHHVATIELTFSGRVDANEVGKRATFALRRGDAQPTAIASVHLEAGAAPHVMIGGAAQPSLRPGDAIEVKVAAGVPLLSPEGHSAPAFQQDLAVMESPTAPAATIRAAYAAEGTSGYYVEVICDDGAVTERGWYWDPTLQQSFEKLSQRCMVTEDDAAEKLHFDPPVAFTVVPAARGFRVFGDFRRGSYALRLEPGARTADGGIVRSSYEAALSIPARTARVAFLQQGRYVPRSQWRSLGFRHVNVENVEVTARLVPAANLVFWASADDETTTKRESDVIAHETIAVKGEPDVLTTSSLDVASLVPPATRGLVELTISAAHSTDAVRLVLTDIELVAKRGAAADGTPTGEVVAWAFDADTMEPLRSANVDLVRASGAVLASGNTDGSGEVRLVPPAPGPDTEPAFGLVARRGRDVTYLAFDEVKAEVSDEQVAGEKWKGEPAWRASLYTDRGVYRPGETAHAAAILRSKTYEAPKAGMPVTLRLVDPRGQNVREATLPVDDTGFVALDLPFPEFAATGRYEAQLDVADQRIATYRFHVEEFVPERMKVDVAPATKAALVGEPVDVHASAKYLFGGVPAHHRAELTCTLQPGSFQPKENASFAYGVALPDGQQQREVLLGTATATLDGEGNGDLACPSTQAGSILGPGRLVTKVAVFEAGSGRTSVGEAAVALHPARFYLGLLARETEAKAGQPLHVDGVVVDWDGKLVTEARDVDLTLYRLETDYGWYYDEDSGSTTRRNAMRPMREGTTRVHVAGGKFSSTLTPAQDGEAFDIRATSGAARTDVTVKGSEQRWYWAEYEGEGETAPPPATTPHAGKPTWIAIEGPPKVRVGDLAEIRFAAPHAGRMLFTIEADRVLERAWKDVEAGPLTWSFRLAEFRPNIYVTALLLKPPHLESKDAYLPDRSFGVVSIPVEPSAFVQDVKLSLPKEVRSGTPLTVTLDLGPQDGPVRATIAAVDEGILSLTKFQSPDPLADVFARRALGVDTFETIGWTLLTSPGTGSGAGSGGEPGGLLGRVDAIKPVSLWSGVKDVPKNGKLQVTFDLPTYRGALRVMAVVAGTKKLGSASGQVIVRDPLTMQVTLPRFLVQGDVAQVPVFVTNLSGAARDVEIAMTASDIDAGGKAGGERAITVTSDIKPLHLADGASGTALFTLRAKGSSGATRVVATATSGDLTSHDELDVPLLPMGPRERVVKRVPLEEGRTVLTSQLTGWEPMSERTTVRVTANPYADVLDHLKYLVHYPYGCIEQTTSVTRALIAFQDSAQDVDPSIGAHGGVEAMVKSGIDRALSMQTPSGGFGYWPGDTRPAYWATAYATHALMDAKAARFAVPQERIDAALAWMEDRITNHFEKGAERHDWDSEGSEPYIQFVLARAGRGRAARVQTLLADVPGFDADERAENQFMLQAALYMTGDRRYEKELRTPDLSPVGGGRRNNWCFYSDLRRRGFMLATHVDLFGADDAAAKLANVVADALREYPSRHYTTQELVWGLTGLDKFTGQAATFDPPVLTADGHVLAPAPQRAGASANERTWNVVRASEYDSLIIDEPKKGEGTLSAILSSEGVRTGVAPQYGGRGLEVTRKFVDADGAAVDLASGPHALGDLVNVVLTIGNTSGERIANVALVDRIPAGWEIENPRLGRGTAVDWIDASELWEADHLDLRDDRIEVFGQLDGGMTKKVVYAVRAVTAGRFTMPPVEAEAMYDSTLWARQPGLALDITGPWAPVSQ